MNRWIDRIRRDEHQLALLLSIVIGALVGLTVVAFILLTGRLAAHMYPAGGAAWRRLLVPTVGALLSGILLFRYFPLARGSGIPQTKFALFVADGMISLRTVLGKFLCCSVSLASGIALGREGPSVQIGAGVASVIGRRLGLGAERVKALLPVGGAAALAAAFNTPIAAVLFALEEIVGDLHAPVLGAVVLSAATAWIILHVFLGDAPLFHVVAYKLVHPAEFAVYAVLGVVGGLASGTFVRLLLALRSRFLRLNQRRAWLHPLVGGLTVGVLGFFVPEVLGVGYDYIEGVLNGDVLLQMLVALALLKIVATAVCYASGNAGGVFGPSLFIGAMVGGAVGTAAHSVFPAYTAAPGAYALVGMGAAFAGIVRTPLASVIMIFELTRDYSIIVPLMIANLIAFYVSQRLQRIPIYEAIALQDGVHLPGGESRGRRGLLVADAMQPVAVRLSSATRVSEASALVQDIAVEAVPVFESDALIAMVRVADIQAALANGMGDASIGTMAEALTSRRPGAALPHVHPDHSAALALERMGSSGHRLLPVISRADARRVLGVLTFADVVSAFGSHDRFEAPPRAASSPAAAPGRRAFVATLGIIAVSGSALTAADIWLVRLDRAETRAAAGRLFEEGRSLERRSRHEDAIARFRSALALSRQNRSYQMALAGSLLAADRGAEARVVAEDVLRADAVDGEANLVVARVVARGGAAADAVAYYRRAIVGRWRDAAAQRSARLELIELLAGRGPREDLLAELLTLQQQELDPATERRAAELYLAAGAPDRSRDMWLRLQRAFPNDPAVHRGLGDAELARRDFRSAQASFRAALRLQPPGGAAGVQQRLALIDDVMTLDPTARTLTPGQRSARSAALLAMARDSALHCPPAAADVGRLDETSLAGPPADGDDAVAANMDLARHLWSLRETRCPSIPASPSEERLALILAPASR